MTTTPSTSGRRSPASPTTRSSGSAPAPISGRWATPAPAARARRSSSTRARRLQGGPPGSPDEDGDRFLEFWNLVFMQYEQLPDGSRVDLPRPSIDTGMGLERIAAIMQGVHSNYDIDLFKVLIGASVEIIGVPATGPNRASHRVIADHLRASSFLIADGVLPSNEGRGYVLRRIMRRAMRHAHLLGAGGAGALPAGADAGRRDGARLSRAGPRRGADPRDAAPRGDALPAHARPRPDAPRRGERRPRHRRHARRRRRLPALRHLRLPARPHRGRAQGARRRGRHRRLRPRHGAAEGGGARELGGVRRGADRPDLVQAPRAARRDRVPRLRRRGGRGRGAGDGPRHRRGGRDGGGRATRSRSSSTRRRSTPNPAARSATPA